MTDRSILNEQNVRILLGGVSDCEELVVVTQSRLFPMLIKA
ncbi:uncharacterized protein METZ01_LOCUS326297 [marine metagenome]|uniref:Uncharacterized protein n=1 Tax=marine metagenome TaxID=408172 RepID=A0A382PJ95_9ZZZZ